jgi:amidohydrolase
VQVAGIPAAQLSTQLARFLEAEEPWLIAVRRHLHAHPELGLAEHQTTELVRSRLASAGLTPKLLPGGTGLLCDIGTAPGPLVALRADLDALPLSDEKDVAYRSTVAGVCHACGHDVHTTILLGAGLALAQLADADQLPGRVRLIFQPAEELTPGGAVDAVDADALVGVGRIYALHCDPRTDVGLVGVRSGPITAAADRLQVRLRGPGGHTSRPHLTADLVYALAKVVTEVPAALSRRVDPRSGLSVVWGQISAGTVANAIPETGVANATVRVLDSEAWQSAPGLLRELTLAAAAPYGVEVEITYQRGVPPVINDPFATELLSQGIKAALGPDATVPTEQSLGGEDFGWYLQHVPGSLGRLGVRGPDTLTGMDLHRGTFDVDESSIAVGVRVLVSTALTALDAG